MELVTIKTFDNSIEAHLLRSKLRSQDVLCFLFDENIVSLNPLYDLMVGGIKLKVAQSDIEQATEIIEKSVDSDLTSERAEIIQCPRCQSPEIYYGFKSMKGIIGVLTALLSFTFGVYPIYYNTVNKCKSCNTEFK